MIAANRQSHGIVLSGGGAYGAYEVGVLRALLTGQSPSTAFQPIRPESYAGTSVGAVNASAMVANSALDAESCVNRLYQYWQRELASGSGRCGNGAFRIRGANPFEIDCLIGQPGSVLQAAFQDAAFALKSGLERGIGYATSSESLTRRTLELLDFSVLLDRDKFAASLAKIAPLDGIRQSNQRLRIVATNFDDGELTVFDNHDIADRVGYQAIMASSAVPGVFPHVEIDGKTYTDGGTLMNAPLLPVIHGSNVLHVVYMDPDVSDIPLKSIKTTLGVLDRLLVTNFAFAMNSSIEAIHDFNDSIRLIRSLDANSNYDGDSENFLKVAASLKNHVSGGEYEPLIIHRYHPKDDLGGVFGFLDFDIKHIDHLIERGFRDTANHDCEAAGCLV